jgi:hypothetical protein
MCRVVRACVLCQGGRKHATQACHMLVDRIEFSGWACMCDPSIHPSIRREFHSHLLLGYLVAAPPIALICSWKKSLFITSITFFWIQASNKRMKILIQQSREIYTEVLVGGREGIIGARNSVPWSVMNGEVLNSMQNQPSKSYASSPLS